MNTYILFFIKPIKKITNFITDTQISSIIGLCYFYKYCYDQFIMEKFINLNLFIRITIILLYGLCGVIVHNGILIIFNGESISYLYEPLIIIGLSYLFYII